MGEDFREQIEKRLSGFSREDVCFFAWLCAVRALPFLALRGNFDHWKHTKNGDQRQKHLFAVLKAIDAVARATRADSYSADDAHYAANDAAYAVRTADTADNARAEAADDAVYYVARAAATAADVAVVVTRAEATAYYVARAAATAADVAVVVTRAAYARADDDTEYTINLRSMLLEDLEIIKINKGKFQNDTTLYGSIWVNFQSALRELGCEYWGEWYEGVFAKGFILDDEARDEIKLRLSVPGEIMERGASDVARYVLELKEKGVERLNEARIIILGNKGSGKTSLARRLENPLAQMPKVDESTEGVDVIDWVIPVDSKQSNSKLNVHIWDFAGHVITHSAHRCFMSARCLYILLINGRTEGDNRIEYWLEQIHNYGGNSPVLVLVNRYDQHPVNIAENTLKKEFPTITGFHQVNINAGGESLEAFRQTVMNHLRDNPLWKDQQISTPIYKVKEVLRQKFAHGDNFIEQKEFNEIAKNNDIKPEEHEQLLKDLHDLGICLWYNDADISEFNEMVLNPSWISHGIYRLINWGSNKGTYKLSTVNFCEIFTGADATQYPQKKAGFLFRLMRRYQLAFFKNPDEIFVPLLFPDDRPESSQLPVFNFGERLRMEYCANQSLPPYTVARVAVVHSKELDKNYSWRFGALLHFGDIDALVEENERARSVTIYVKGKDSEQTMCLSKLRDTLDSIFDDYKSSRPEQKYEVLLPPDLASDPKIKESLSHTDSNKLLQSGDHIIGTFQRNQYMFIETIGKSFSFKTTMDGYNLHNQQSNEVIFVTTTNIGNVSGYNHTINVQQGVVNTFNKHQNIEFRNCLIPFQEELNALARNFRNLSTPEDMEIADELEGVVSDLDEILKETPANATPSSPEMDEVRRSVQKKGRLKWLKNLYDDLRDENSELYKKTMGLRKGVKTLQTIGDRYNDVAQWLCLPQIPRPLLGSNRKTGNDQ